MKNYTIDMIQAMTETDAAAIALEKLDVKGHTVYLVDFGGYFGYSCLVFKNGHHIYYANDYELHHKWRKATQKQLREVYVEKLGNILFTLEEIASPLSDYAEYERRSRYLHNYYGMQEDNISLFDAGGTKQEVEERKKKIATMIFNPVGFAYYTNADFVREHIALFQRLEPTIPTLILYGNTLHFSSGWKRRGTLWETILSIGSPLLSTRWQITSMQSTGRRTGIP